MFALHLPDRTAQVGQVFLDGQPDIVRRQDLSALRRPGRVVSKSQFVDELYDHADEKNPAMIEVFISRLRRKLADAQSDAMIRALRGLGYRIVNEQLEAQAHSNDRWRCFVARRKGRSVRVCERIEDANGQGFTDTSSWYWASVAGQSHGPWKAITVATPL